MIEYCSEEKKTLQDSGYNNHPRCVNDSVQAYELLRDQCVEHPSKPSTELGLSVLLRNGMLAWTSAYLQQMSTERTCSVAPDAQPAAPSRSSLIDIMVCMVTGGSRVGRNNDGGMKA